MAERKRIALLLGQADENYQEQFIRSFLTQAFSDDLDVCIFSMYLKYQSTAARETGEANIYTLVNYHLFDAVVLLLDTIQTPGVADALVREIKKEFSGPVLTVDLETKDFPGINTDSYTPVRKLIDHLIEVHDYRDIAFLTGKKWHPHSVSRLKAYRDSMEAHGLTVREDRIFYGDYWYSSGYACAEELMKNPKDLPRAIACANDQMAIGVCQSMIGYGLKIPQDIAVIGYDSVEEGRTSPVPLTSAFIPASSTGKHAAVSIKRLMDGLEIEAPSTEVDLFLGGSCGCDAEAVSYLDRRRKSWETDLSAESIYSMHNRMPEDLMLQTDLHRFLDTVYNYLVQIKGYDRFYLCLNDEWAAPAALSKGRVSVHGYTERMLKVMTAYGDEKTEGHISTHESFETSRMLPEIFEDHTMPQAWFFTPVHFEESCFGYAVVNYGDTVRSYDEAYRLWVQALMRGLENLRRNILMQEKKSLKMGEESGKQLSPEEQAVCDEVAAILTENRLTYYYQPIVSAVDGKIYAFEALMRAKSEMKISPLQIIKYATHLKRLADVEKATFLNVLGQMESNEEAFGDCHIFINSIPGTKLDERDYQKIEEMLTKRGKQAVVELTEQAELDDEELDRMKARFARMGIGTAVDDYGTGYSNVSNLLRYMPNYVKVDRSLLSGIQDSPQKQHFVREIVTFSHDNGILVLAEGVETGEELGTVIRLGCDLIQGYYTGRPSPEVLSQIDESIIEEICRCQKERQEGSLQRVFVTGKANRYRMGNLINEGYTYIECRAGEVTCRDFTLSGTPGQRADLQICIRSGYEGVITMEHVHLNSTKHLPCIDIEPGGKLTLVLVGDNYLFGGGIRVPKGAEFTLRGDGNLSVTLNVDDLCGIGDPEGAAGKMEFYQEGTLTIDGNGRSGLCIGGRDAAEVIIRRGRYMLQMISDTSVAIGCMDGDADLVVRECELNITISGTDGVGIGSMRGNAYVDLESVFFHFVGRAKQLAVSGSIYGKKAQVRYSNMGSNIDVRGDRVSGAGSIEGSSSVYMENMSYRYTGSGKESYAYGGVSGEEGGLIAINSNLAIRIRNESGRAASWKDEYMSFTDCRGDITLNGTMSEIMS